MNLSDEPKGVPSMFTPVGQIDTLIKDLNALLDRAYELAGEERDPSSCPHCSGSPGHFHPVYPPREMEHMGSRMQEALYWAQEARQAYLDEFGNKKAK